MRSTPVKPLKNKTFPQYGAFWCNNFVTFLFHYNDFFQPICFISVSFVTLRFVVAILLVCDIVQLSDGKTERQSPTNRTTDTNKRRVANQRGYTGCGTCALSQMCGDCASGVTRHMQGMADGNLIACTMLNR